MKYIDRQILLFFKFLTRKKQIQNWMSLTDEFDEIIWLIMHFYKKVWLTSPRLLLKYECSHLNYIMILIFYKIIKNPYDAELLALWYKFLGRFRVWLKNKIFKKTKNCWMTQMSISGKADRRVKRVLYGVLVLSLKHNIVLN